MLLHMISVFLLSFMDHGIHTILCPFFWCRQLAFFTGPTGLFLLLCILYHKCDDLFNRYESIIGKNLIHSYISWLLNLFASTCNFCSGSENTFMVPPFSHSLIRIIMQKLSRTIYHVTLNLYPAFPFIWSNFFVLR